MAHGGPTHTAQKSSERDEGARADAIDQPARKRHDPGFKRDEEGEGILNLRQVPVRPGAHRIDEERPGILQVGDHDHRDYRRDELNPAAFHGLDSLSMLTAEERARRYSEFGAA